MSVPFSNTPLRIPRGFGSLLEGLSREVLREQPQDIIGFASRYFQRLLKIREETGVDPADWAARLEDRFYNNHIFKEKVVHVVKEEPVPVETISSVYLDKDDMAKVDQPASLEKKVVVKCVKKPVQSTASAAETNAETPAKPEPAISPELIQPEQPKSQVSSPPFSLTFSPPDSLLVSPSTQEGSEKQEVEEIIEMAKEDLTNQTENEAAVRIQAVYRGYMTRKKLVKGNATEAEGDGLTEEHAGGGTGEYSSEEELTFADDGDFGLTGAEEEEEEEEVEEEGEEEESRGGTGDEQTGGEAAGNRASTGLGVEVQLADPPAEEESYAGWSGGGLEDPDADVCGSELGPETREGDTFEEEMGSRADDWNIPAAESGIEGSAEAAFGFDGAADVDVRGAGLGAPLTGGEVGASGNAGGSAQSDGDLHAPSPEGAELSRTGGQAPDEGGQSQGFDEEDWRGGESELPEPEDGVSPADETRAVETAESVAEKGETCGKAVEEDILDIPLDDEEANAAAAKIQASFRGHMTRKKLKGGEKEESERKGGGGMGGAPEEGEEPDAGGEAPTDSADTAGGAEGQSEAGGEAKEGVAVNGDQSETAAGDGGKDAGDAGNETEAAAPEQ